MRIRYFGAVVALTVSALSAGGAQAAYPGPNGLIAFTRFVFVDEGDHSFEERVFVMDANGAGQRQLSTDDGRRPAWSGDGTKLVFAGTGNPRTGFLVINADGTGETPVPNTSNTDLNPKLSPDGDRIAFERELGGGANDIFTIDRTGTNLAQLTHDGRSHNPVWSPAGDKLVFVRFNPSGLFVMDANGANDHLLTTDFASAATDWSPDGSRIAFFRIDAGVVTIFTMNSDGTNPQRVAAPPASARDLAWSPDGTKLVYSNIVGATRGIFEINADGSGGPVQLTSAARDEFPSWGPQPAVSIAPIVLTGGPDSSKLDVQVDDIAGSKVRYTFNDVVPLQVTDTRCKPGPPIVCESPIEVGAEVNLGAGDDEVTVSGNHAFDQLTVDGGPGNDTLVASPIARGGAGSDTITAGGNCSVTGCRLVGGDGDDILTGGPGSDRLLPGTGGDTVSGALGEDTVDYSDLPHRVIVLLHQQSGSEGGDVDFLTGMEDVTGTDFDDQLVGNAERNVLDGGAGQDTLEGQLDGQNDELQGGPGIDTLDYSRHPGGIAVQLDADTVSDKSSGAVESVKDVENATGSASNDDFEGDEKHNVFNGGPGADSFFGTLDGSNDELIGGPDDDSIDYTIHPHPVVVSLDLQLVLDRTTSTTESVREIESVYGSAFDDDITGTDGEDTLDGQGGNDVIESGKGDDWLFGGPGSDTIDYANAAGHVEIFLAAGATNEQAGTRDNLTSIENAIGSAGGDIVVGDDGPNRLAGGGGADSMDGLLGADEINGGLGADSVSYRNNPGAVDVTLNDALPNDGGPGEGDRVTEIENVRGSDGDDFIVGTDGPNILEGFDGEDRFMPMGGDDEVEGGDLSDTVDYSTAPGAVDVLLSADVADEAAGTTDLLVEVENAIGSSFDDGVFGDSDPQEANRLEGGAGDDLLSGARGPDDMNGGTGIDTVSYVGASAAVDVTLDFGNADDGTANEGDNVVNVENVFGTQFDDLLVGNGEANRLEGVKGGDAIFGGGGDDVLFGDSGADVIDGESGADTVDGGQGDDVLGGGLDEDTVVYADRTAAVFVDLRARGPGDEGESGEGDAVDPDVENVVGGSGNDVFEGNASRNRLEGAGGDDVLTGEGGQDVLDGGSGKDSLSSRDGDADTDLCGPGVDDEAFADALDIIDSCEKVLLPQPPPPAPTGNTPTGSNVSVTPVDATTLTFPLTVTFGAVTTPGQTLLFTSQSGPIVPAGFQVGSPPTFYFISTTAGFSPPVTICIDMTGITFPTQPPTLFHFDQLLGTWVDITTRPVAPPRICGISNTLSPFAVLAPKRAVKSVRCIVPNVKRKTLPAARKSIVRAHCSVGRVRGKGRVISQQPRPGAQLKKGAKVNLVLRRGKRR